MTFYEAVQATKGRGKVQFAVSILLSGISVGGQYALIAIGYTMVYGILRLINFAHGDVFMVAGLVLVYMSASMPLYISIPLMIVFIVALGFMIERGGIQAAQERPAHVRHDKRYRRKLPDTELCHLLHRRPAADIPPCCRS